MKPGLYEQILTRRLAQKLATLPPELTHSLRQVDPAEAPRILAHHLANAIIRTLTTTKDRADLTNALLQLLQQPHDEVDEDLRELLAILPNTPITSHPERPGLPLSVTELLVNARGEHRIGTEIQKELASADRVDLLCSFLKWSGFRLVRSALEQLIERGGKLRVLTTCYLGVTQGQVLDELAKLGGEIRVSYNTERTRLHAKAWLFHRDTGFSTGYIGSSNLSGAAMLDGLEWNVRISHVDSPRVLEKFQATFDSYWEDSEFEPYCPQRDRLRFERARKSQEPRSHNNYTLDVAPYPFQTEILERLNAERTLHDRRRNLIVAATGTGKTVMAALDYRTHQRASLLFVAHRGEILEQSLNTFRAVLKDGSFGELWTGDSAPTQDRHLFASVQKLQHVDLEAFRPEHFDVLIIDEFHHAAAPTYRKILDHFRPRILLGLTATPERADGQSIRRWFDATVELRLWDALERGLLTPFHYFGLHDNVDLTRIAWSRGRYDLGQLDNLYTGHVARAALVLKQLQVHVQDPGSMRALGFCAGVSHARFMAEQFQKAGLNAAAVVGDTPDAERRQALADLRERRVQIVFSVDVFNEGVDVPEVDTVLLLRPTESATVFLQQLGRGLRLHPDKECLTVLDFIGMTRREFRFDQLYVALLGGTRNELRYQIEQGFPLLPSGCSMQLDRVATGIVLDNLKTVLRNRSFLRAELQRVGEEASLGEFLRRSGVELEDVARVGWIELRRDVGFPTPPGDVPPGIGRLTHLDSLELIRFLQSPVATSLRQERMRWMLHFALWPRGEAARHQLDELSLAAREELRSLLECLQDRVDHLDQPLPEHPDVPLRVHCHYTRDEILAAFGVLTLEQPHPIREGVLFHKPSGCDLFFATINKSERDYSPSTMYRDFAVSPELFHWESQSNTPEDSPRGSRYQSHRGETHALLFVREHQKKGGQRAPYLFLGPAYYVSHEGERPMAVTWRLKHPIPMQFYRGLRLAA